jgi:oligosaccharide repeat unit polymerase
MSEWIGSLSWNVLYALDLMAIFLFVLSYYRNCYRKGYRIDFWHEQLFLACVLPNMLMLPFAQIQLNAVLAGATMAGAIVVLPTVFIITLVGYFAMLAGGWLWRFQLGVGIRATVAKALNTLPRCSMMLMSSRGVLLFQAGLCVFLQWLILAYYFSQSGLAFDLRLYTFENPTLRPIALIISNYSIIIGSHCLARYVDTKERNLLAGVLLISFGLLFFGARWNLALIYLNVLICYLVKLRNKISLFRIASLAIVIVVFALYLGNVRLGEYSLVSFVRSVGFLLLFGDNFSDLRDFAWVYSAWDHVLWGGKTYLAAIVSFVPRFASKFRDTWALGATTASMVGLDPQIHPGVRPSIFGEGYFNFGLLGVIAVGLILGVTMKRVDIDVKRSLLDTEYPMRKAFASTMLLNVLGFVAISSGTSALYVLAGVYLFSWFCLSVQRMFHPRQMTQTSGAS